MSRNRDFGLNSNRLSVSLSRQFPAISKPRVVLSAMQNENINVMNGTRTSSRTQPRDFIRNETRNERSQSNEPGTSSVENRQASNCNYFLKLALVIDTAAWFLFPFIYIYGNGSFLIIYYIVLFLVMVGTIVLLQVNRANIPVSDTTMPSQESYAIDSGIVNHSNEAFHSFAEESNFSNV